MNISTIIMSLLLLALITITGFLAIDLITDYYKWIIELTALYTIGIMIIPVNAVVSYLILNIDD